MATTSDESICSESNVTIENDIAQLDHLYYKIEENESKCSMFRTENPDVVTTKNVILKQDSSIKTGKYFKPYPEIRQINHFIRKKKKPFLLPNGLKCMRP